MTGTALIGLGLLAYGFYRLKSTQKDLEETKSQLDYTENKLTNTQQELQSVQDKEADAQGDNFYNDLEVVPEFHLDCKGGKWMSMLYLNLTNHSKTQTYRIDNIRATAEILGVSVNHIYFALKDNARSIRPQEKIGIPVWVRMRAYEATETRSGAGVIDTVEERIFYSQFKRFQDEISLAIGNKRLSSVIETDNFLITEFKGGLILPELTVDFKTASQEWIPQTLPNVHGNVYVYFTKYKNTYADIRNGNLSYEISVLDKTSDNPNIAKDARLGVPVKELLYKLYFAPAETTYYDGRWFGDFNWWLVNGRKYETYNKNNIGENRRKDKDGDE